MDSFLLIYVIFFCSGYLYYLLNAYFRKSNTAIARIEAVSRSPIYADFSQTLSGTSTIRAYHQQDRFIKTLEKYADSNTVPGFLLQLASQWLSIRLDILGGILMFFMGALTVSTKQVSFIPAGYLALGLSYSIQITSMLKMAVRVNATLEAQFNSVERMRYYSENFPIEQELVGEVEEPLKTQHSKIKGPETASDIEMGQINVKLSPAKKGLAELPDWPTKGEIEFRNVDMSYRNGPLVLKNVSFFINSKDKIGVAGFYYYPRNIIITI